ncbi:MAG: CotH kinase family protein [Blautia sp.]
MEKLFYSVGIRPKGNTSLSSIASDPDTDRYSFKLEFDHYIEGQSCYGLDKLILNNNYADATNMKEAIVYDMYQYLGVDASLYNYARISVNGDYWGVYLALEGVEDSFMLRNYGTQDGNLYKPESMGVGGGDENDGENTKMGERPDDFELPDGTEMPQVGTSGCSRDASDGGNAR